MRCSLRCLPSTACHAPVISAIARRVPRRPCSGSSDPSNVRARLRFALPEAGHVRLDVYDVRGRRVALLLDEVRTPGWREAVLDGRGLASGLYLVRLETGGRVLTRRISRAR